MCRIMETSQLVKRSPKAIFLQACVAIDPVHAFELAEDLYHLWLIDETISEPVSQFCDNLMTRELQRRRNRRKK